LVFSVLATFYKRLARDDSLELQRWLHSLQVIRKAVSDCEKLTLKGLQAAIAHLRRRFG